MIKKRITSNASRKHFFLNLLLRAPRFFNNFKIRNSLKRGRSLYNGKVVRTKKLNKNKFSISNSFFLRDKNSFFLKIGYIKYGFKSKISTVCLDLNGFVFLLPFFSYNNLFKYFLIKPFLLKKSFFNNLLIPLYFLKKKIQVNYVEGFFKKKSTYVRSFGCFSFLVSRNIYLHTVLLEMPSKARKYFKMSSLSLKFFKTVYLKLKTWTTKSGYYRNFGINTLSRGVAKNPVDHPNGGRTKALRCPKTPWGFVAKKK